MSRFNPADSGYIEVKDRVLAFKEKHPEGSIQSEVVHLSDSLVIMKAYAYRTPDDIRPGIGHSQMKIPGPTNFTKDSEVENAETSAIGRAIAALGFEVHRSYSSANEANNKQSEKPEVVGSGGGGDNEDRRASKAQQDELKALAAEYSMSKEEMSALRKAHTDKAKSSEFTVKDYNAMKVAIVESGKIKAATGGEIVS